MHSLSSLTQESHVFYPCPTAIDSRICQALEHLHAFTLTVPFAWNPPPLFIHMLNFCQFSKGFQLLCLYR